MLNMLIAVMTDTYERVMHDINPSNYLELANIILEHETLLFWKRDKGKLQFLTMAEYLQKDSLNNWEGKGSSLLKMRETSESQGKKSMILLDQVKNEILDKLLVFNRDTNLKFDEQKKRFDFL